MNIGYHSDFMDRIIERANKRNERTENEPMTNEEWFCKLSTEEKAEFLVKIEMSAMHPVKRGAVDMEKFIEEVVEWLKQPHTPKE